MEEPISLRRELPHAGAWLLGPAAYALGSAYALGNASDFSVKRHETATRASETLRKVASSAEEVDSVGYALHGVRYGQSCYPPVYSEPNSPGGCDPLFTNAERAKIIDPVTEALREPIDQTQLRSEVLASANILDDIAASTRTMHSYEVSGIATLVLWTGILAAYTARALSRPLVRQAVRERFRWE